MSSRNPHKLKPSPRPLFSCCIFRNCTISLLNPRSPPSSTSPPPPFLPSSPPPPPPPPPPNPSSSTSSSSSSASHSFTQWRFPLHHHQPAPLPYHSAESHFSQGHTSQALSLLQQSLSTSVPSPPATPPLLSGVVAALRLPDTARPAAKVLLSLLLSEGNRRLAVEAGAVGAAVDAVAGAGTTVKERSLAALELLCTVEDGAAEVRGNGVAAKVLAGAAEEMVGRGRECAIGVLAAVYGGEMAAEAPEEVVASVEAALRGECTARGRRKGEQLLLALKKEASVTVN